MRLEYRNLLDLDTYVVAPVVTRILREDLCVLSGSISDCISEPMPQWLVARAVPHGLCTALVRLHLYELILEVCAFEPPVRQGELYAPPYVRMERA
jgi:hypothetical protein